MVGALDRSGVRSKRLERGIIGTLRVEARVPSVVSHVRRLERRERTLTAAAPHASVVISTVDFIFIFPSPIFVPVSALLLKRAAYQLPRLPLALRRPRPWTYGRPREFL